MMSNKPTPREIHSRRQVLALTGLALASPRALFAQGRRVFRIALFDETSEKARPSDWAAFRARLRELGLREGENAEYVARFANSEHERLPALAKELVAAKPDVIVCGGTPATRAALRVTESVPIVFTAAGDPVGTGLVSSLSRPGGNATGFSAIAPEINLKALELLRELVPGLARVALLSDPANPSSSVAYSRFEEEARRYKLVSRMLDGVGPLARERAFETVHRERIQGLVVAATTQLLDQREQIVQHAARARLPVVYGRREYVEAGGLVFHGVHRRRLFARTAELVHRILQGARPADIPVEQISVFQTVLNLRTARAQGIKIPEAIRIRADEVIE